MLLRIQAGWGDDNRYKYWLSFDWNPRGGDTVGRQPIKGEAQFKANAVSTQTARIRIATPRHNGKVERQHRIDQLRFYDRLRMYSLVDGRRQLAVYQKKSNDYIKHCLGLRSPNQVLADYLAVM